MGDPPDHGGDRQVELGLAAELLALSLWVSPLYLGAAALQWGDAGWDLGLGRVRVVDHVTSFFPHL